MENRINKIFFSYLNCVTEILLSACWKMTQKITYGFYVIGTTIAILTLMWMLDVTSVTKQNIISLEELANLTDDTILSSQQTDVKVFLPKIKGKLEWKSIYNKTEIYSINYRLKHYHQYGNVHRYCLDRVPCVAIPYGYFFEYQSWVKMMQNPCEYKCDYVYDIVEADAVIIHARDMFKHTYKQWKRHPNQFWIYLSTESPLATQHWGFDVSAHSVYRHFFNWTATYMRNSDIYLPYGEYLPYKQQPQSNGQFAFYTPETKTKFAYVIMSNCRAYNNRVNKVKHLQEFMSIDAFGKCFDKNLVYSDNLFLNMSKKYRFYLSFENAFCKEYISEKLFNNALQTEAVAVVFGGMSKADYEAVAPPNSFIYALDFKSPRDLAKYLYKLAHDEAEYAKFFEWKKEFRFISSYREDRMLCNVCKKLYLNKTRSVSDLQPYYNLNNCKPRNYTYLD